VQVNTTPKMEIWHGSGPCQIRACQIFCHGLKSVPEFGQSVPD